MKKSIMKRKENAGWVINTNSGIIHCDKEGCWWLGGSSCVHVALFSDKKEALSIMGKIQRNRPDLIKWTKVVPVSFVTKI